MRSESELKLIVVRLWRCVVLCFLFAPLFAAVALPTCARGDGIRVPRGKGEFVFVDERGDRSKRITVFTYCPEQADLKSAPILFVMHGHHKSAENYRSNWARHADKQGFLVFAPLFDEEQWPHGAYSYSSVVDRQGQIRDPALWSFSVIEHLFDAIKQATGNQQPRYLIFGFSEGGQFVQRFVQLLPNARYSRAIAASPGWYMMPRFDIKYPYGLQGSPVTEASLKRSFARDFVLLLGEADNDPNHAELNKSPKAMAQGPHRLARGRTFFEVARQQSQKLQTPFNWHVFGVPGADHRLTKIANAAAKVFANSGNGHPRDRQPERAVPERTVPEGVVPDNK
jgi:poly(3-hydroxybutyrate) depolymerase